MSAANLVKVARLHLVDRFSYTWMVWGLIAFIFAINVAIFAVIPLTQPAGDFTGALISIYIFMAVIGVQAATKFLPTSPSASGPPCSRSPRARASPKRPGTRSSTGASQLGTKSECSSIKAYSVKKKRCAKRSAKVRSFVSRRRTSVAE